MIWSRTSIFIIIWLISVQSASMFCCLFFRPNRLILGSLGIFNSNFRPKPAFFELVSFWAFSWVVRLLLKNILIFWYLLLLFAFALLDMQQRYGLTIKLQTCQRTGSAHVQCVRTCNAKREAHTAEFLTNQRCITYHYNTFGTWSVKREEKKS